MATQWINFSDYNVGDDVSHLFQELWVDGGGTVTISTVQEDGNGDHYVELTRNNNASEHIVGTLAASREIDFIAFMEMFEDSNSLSASVVAHSTEGSNALRFAGKINIFSGDFQILEVDEGSGTTLVSESIGSGNAARNIRIQSQWDSGTSEWTLNAKYWRTLGSVDDRLAQEPGSWELTTTQGNTLIDDVGRPSIGDWNSDNDFKIYGFSIGTDGDAAPTSNPNPGDSYQLKSTGLATDLELCVAIDGDGQTLKEFVNGWTSVWNSGDNSWTNNDSASMAVDAGVEIGAASWKGATRSYFRTKGETEGFAGVDMQEYAIGDGYGIFAALGGTYSDGARGERLLLQLKTGGSNGFMLRDTGAGANIPNWDQNVVATSTITDDGETPFSVGGNYVKDTTDTTVVYGLESGSLSQEASGNPGNINRDEFAYIGSRPGGYPVEAPSKIHVIAVFNRTLTESEYQTLHDDWFGTLFEVSGSDTTAPTVDSAATDSAGDTVTVTFDEALDTANDTAAGEWVINVNDTSVGITSAAIDTNSTTDVVIELDSAVSSGDTVTIDYSGTTLRDDAGNQVATFTDESVTNNASGTTGPALTNPTGTATGENTADGSVDTDTGSGTLYWVVTESSTKPSISQIQSGQDHNGSAAADSDNQSVSSTGTQNVSASGLTAGTTYYFHFQQSAPE